MRLNRHHPPLLQDRPKAGPSKVRPRICWMRCLGVPSKCWLCSTTCVFLLPTTRPSGTFAGRKFSKRFLAPFAVRLGSPLFAASAAIFRRCRSKDTPCFLLLRLSSMVNLYRSLGHLSSYSFGLAIFARKTLSVDEVGEHFVHRQRNSIIGANNATIGRNLQYIQFHLADKPVTVINMHGLWNGKGKTDSPKRLEQSRKVKGFLETISGAKILCGDLNVLPTTQSLALLEQDLRNLVKAYGITSTRSPFYQQPDRFADYVLVSPDVQVEGFQVLDEEVSDHSPLLLTFRRDLAHDTSQT